MIKLKYPKLSLKVLAMAICLTVSHLIAHNVLAAGSSGGDGGGGGAANEITVYEIRESILEWIVSGDAKDIVFKKPEVMNYTKYRELMVPVLIAPPDLDAVVIGFVTTVQEQRTNDNEQKVIVDGNDKGCRGFVSKKDHRRHILCNSDLWPESSTAQFKLIHHEFAGLVSVEKNIGAASDYEISSQLSDFGHWARVYKLGPKRKSSHSLAKPVQTTSFKPPSQGLTYALDNGSGLVGEVSPNSMQVLKLLPNGGFVVQLSGSENKTGLSQPVNISLDEEIGPNIWSGQAPVTVHLAKGIKCEFTVTLKFSFYGLLYPEDSAVYNMVSISSTWPNFVANAYGGGAATEASSCDKLGLITASNGDLSLGK